MQGRPEHTGAAAGREQPIPGHALLVKVADALNFPHVNSVCDPVPQGDTDTAKGV